MNTFGWLALGALAVAAPGYAQDSVFLRPVSFHIAVGDPVAIHLESVAGPIAWSDPAVSWLYLRGQGTQKNMDRAPAAPDAAGDVLLPAPPAGAAAAGVDLRPTTQTFDAAVLRAFAASHGLESFPKDAKGPQRVERRQSCRTLLRCGNEPASQYAAISKAGQAAEIVTQMDPTRALVGSDLAVATNVGGEGVAARILATPLATGKTTEFRTNDKGRGSVRVSAAGLWRLEFHRLERGPSGGPDWILTSATLTFEVPEVNQ